MYFHQPSYKGKARNNKHHTYLWQKGSLGRDGAHDTMQNSQPRQATARRSGEAGNGTADVNFEVLSFARGVVENVRN